MAVHGIPYTNKEPEKIGMAVKGSYTKSSQSAVLDVVIDGRRMTSTFDLAPLAHYDIILGSPMLYENGAIIDCGQGTVTFGSPGRKRQQPDIVQKTSMATTVTEDYLRTRFPKLFPHEFELRLPPLRPKLNHHIRWRKDADPSKLPHQIIPIPHKFINQYKANLDRWDKAGIAEIAEGIYSVPMFTTVKPHTNPPQPRFVTNLRARNKMILPDHTPIPNQDNIREDAARAKFKTLIDMKDFYFQIRVDPGSEDYNVISTPFGCRKIRVMLMGDCNAPATCMRIMHTIFHDAIGRWMHVYLDDILIIS